MVAPWILLFKVSVVEKKSRPEVVWYTLCISHQIIAKSPDKMRMYLADYAIVP